MAGSGIAVTIVPMAINDPALSMRVGRRKMRKEADRGIAT